MAKLALGRGQEGKGLAVAERRTIKVFLSHRYKATAVNLYFFRLLSEVADVQFMVDSPDLVVTDKRLERRTSVTRLERRLRDADAFIGVYPIPTPQEAEVTGTPVETDLAKAARYLKLETGLALRSGLPALVFMDQRFRPLIPLCDTFHVQMFDTMELSATVRAATEARLRKEAAAFADEVGRSVEYRAVRSGKGVGFGTVGVFLPDDDSYTPETRARILGMIAAQGFEARQATYPFPIDAGLYALAGSVDWALTDLRRRAGDPSVADVLHTMFVPSVRLMAEAASDTPTELEKRLFPYEVGYAKDVVRWTDATQVLEELEIRLLLLKQDEGRLIGARSEAEEYFLGAAKRKEVVFLSYTSKDAEFASAVSRELRRNFQSVFDYRDGESITPGKPWLKEIFEKLEQSSIGVSVLSAAYFASGNCEHEAQQMVAQADSGKFWFIGVKAGKEDLSLPAYMQSVQYLRAWEHQEGNAAAIVARIKKLFDDSKKP